MKLNKMKKEDLELLSYTKIAMMYLEENKKTLNTAELFKAVCNLLELSENDYVSKIADFFQSLTTSKDFILLDDGTWDLKNNHSIKLDIDELYEDNTNEENEEDSEDKTTEDTSESIDEINNDDSLLEDEEDNELSDLTIIEDEDLDE